jgi:hypothetical protein
LHHQPRLQSQAKRTVLRVELLRILQIDYLTVNEFYSHSERVMSELYHKILKPKKIIIDAESWVELILNQKLSSQKRLAQWQELSPELYDLSLQKIIDTVADLLNNVRYIFKDSDSRTPIIAALLENPNTPENSREQLGVKTRYAQKLSPV